MSLTKKLLIAMFVCLGLVLLGTLGFCFEATLFLAPFFGTLIGIAALGAIVCGITCTFTKNGLF